MISPSYLPCLVFVAKSARIHIVSDPRLWIRENLVVEINLSFIYLFLCKFRCVCFYLSLRALYRRNEVQVIVEY